MSDFDRKSGSTRLDDANAELQEGRQACARGAWVDAYRSLSLADRAAPLGVEDLERLATAAYLIGRDEDYLKTLERSHLAHLDFGETPRAIRCAFWLGLRFLLRGETGPATGWLARAQRLLDRKGRDCVERGYLLLPSVMQHIDAADWRPRRRWQARLPRSATASARQT